MKIAIMQPYFLPYIGYFQLIKSVDRFIFYDDVTFIKQGWINRNRILLNGKEYSFHLELKGASSFKKINEIEIGNNREKLLKTFTQGYKKAPFFKDVEPLIDSLFKSSENNLSKFIVFSFQAITSYLGIKTHFLVSSEIEKNNELKGQEKVIEICNKLGATIYINSIGGQKLYSKDRFKEKNIILYFLKSNPIIYPQFNNEFVSWLSIIDVLMFNSVEEIHKMLDNYELL